MCFIKADSNYISFKKAECCQFSQLRLRSLLWRWIMLVGSSWYNHHFRDGYKTAQHPQTITTPHLSWPAVRLRGDGPASLWQRETLMKQGSFAGKRNLSGKNERILYWHHLYQCLQKKRQFQQIFQQSDKYMGIHLNGYLRKPYMQHWCHSIPVT